MFVFFFFFLVFPPGSCIGTTPRPFFCFFFFQPLSSLHLFCRRRRVLAADLEASRPHLAAPTVLAPRPPSCAYTYHILVGCWGAQGQRQCPREKPPIARLFMP